MRRQRSGGLAALVASGAIALAACSGSSTPKAGSPPTASAVTTIGNGDRSTTIALRAGPIDPSYFADGSCMRYEPMSRNRHITVFLDAGHGGIDPGAVGTTETGKTIYEADVTLPVELDTMTLLRANGFTVVVSRTRNTTVLRMRSSDLDGNVLSLTGAHDEVAARDICANDADANLLVGIYFDASSSSYSAGSVTTYDAVRPFSNQNMRFAELLQSSVVAEMNHKGWQVPNAGVLDDLGMGSSNGDPATSGLAASALEYDHLMLLGPAMKGYFTTPSQMPGALIEPLFITDPFEGSIAANAKDQRVIATGIARAVEEYFSSHR
jgi:N-acetylmuramoyl-L-alanine amidase